jgi:hypothetical protein
MPATEKVTALRRLFSRKPVATLDELRYVLGTRSRTTVFRVISRVGYQTSFSHAGRFYTLTDIPQFDARGLWFHEAIGFSAHGTLRATVIALVDRAPAGYTHEDLRVELNLRVQDTLRSLVHDGLVGRERVGDVYVYVSAHSTSAGVQLAERRAAAQRRPAPVLPLDPARTIDVLLAVIHHPGEEPKAIAARLTAEGRQVSLEQIEALFRRHDLAEKKSSARSHSKRSRR